MAIGLEIYIYITRRGNLSESEKDGESGKMKVIYKRETRREI